jgi:hypothetical protein
VRFTIFVKFHSTGKLIVDQDEITIALKSRPKGNKVNLELIKKPILGSTKMKYGYFRKNF